MFGSSRQGSSQALQIGAILISGLLIAAEAYAQDAPLPDWQVEALAKKAKGKIGPGVEEALEARGSARVIIALQRPESLRRPERSRFNEIRREIEANQNSVLGALGSGEHTLNRRYSLVPALAATIHSKAGLERLANHSLVVGVELDGQATGGLADSVPLIRADSMHAHGYTGDGVVAAILDSGIDTDHPDLVDDLIYEECFLSDPVCHNGLVRDSGPGSAEDDLGHGTHVSGTITSSGIVSSVGVAPDVQIVAVKVLAYNNRGWWSDIMAALDWVLYNRPDVDLINMSLGGGLYSSQCDNQSSFTVSFANLINSLRSVGVTTFVSAGNDASPTQMEFPACLSGVISVGATNDFDQVASFSNTNPYTDLVAPGVGIVADVPGGGVAAYNGTSMASPHALACAALQMEAGRATVPGAIESWLKGSGVPVTDARNGLTFPRVDCFAEPSYAPPGNLLAAAGPPDGTGGCGGTGAYTLNVIGGTISRTSDTAFNHWAVGYSCWRFDEQYTRVYVVANDPATFNHWESPSGNNGLIDGHNGTSTTTVETSFNLLGQSPTFEAVHNGGAPTPDLLRVDNLSGAGTIVGPLSGGSSSVYPAAAVHPATDVMYAGGADGAAVLHTVDKTTGALTPIGPAGSGITRIAAMDFRSDGTLFASVKVGSSGGPGANYLATINTSTGAATLIGSFGTCTARCSIEGMGAIAFDPGGVLYGALHERAQNGSPGLYTINTSTGIASFVGPIVDGTAMPSSGGITSLQFLDGVLYGGTAIAKAPPGDGGWLVAINKTSGTFSKVGLSSATGGRGLIGLAVGPPGDPPENDDLADATTVGALPYAGSGTTENATNEPSEAFGSCAADHGFSIWWSFTATESDLVEINTNGSAINTGLSIWTGAGHPLTQFECDDDSGEGDASRVIFDAIAGTEYFIRVIGVAGETGSVNINVAPPAMTNDDLVRAIPLGPLPSTDTGTNIGATREPAEQIASCGFDGGNSVWWSFTPAAAGIATIDTEGSNFDTMLGIWTGSGHPLTEIACNDDGGTGVLSMINFTASAGVTYYLRVTGFGGSSGDIVLNASMTAPFSCSAQTQIPQEECNALVALYDSTGGDDWTWNTGWKLTNTPCSWYGIACEEGHVVEIFLAPNGLTGPIPSLLGTLSDLQRIYFSGNSLSGPIPASLGNLQNLVVLELPGNQLTGPIPAALGNLSSVERFQLGSNPLGGSIPSSLGNLPNLKVLDLGNSNLTGSIPSSLGNLSRLTGLYLGLNYLSGPPPNSLGNLDSLEYFALNNNNLQGTVTLTLATIGASAEWCDFHSNDPSFCMPDTPEYQALATGGFICGLPLDSNCEPLPPPSKTVTLIRDLITVPEESIQALSAAGAALTEPVMDSLLSSHLDLETEFTIRGVVLTDPLKSGLATWNAARGGPDRVHLYIRDPAADSLGNTAMGIQLVDDAYEENGTLDLIPGDVIEVTGHLLPFYNSILFVPTALVLLGSHSDMGLSDGILAPDTLSGTGDINQGVGFEKYQANWTNYNALNGSYICVDDATIFRRTVTGSREDWAVTSDAGATGVVSYDMSLRYRNDRTHSYLPPFHVRSTPFVPPELGSIVLVCGTVEHRPFNDPYSQSMPDNAMLSLIPWKDSDLVVTGRELTVDAKVFLQGPFAAGAMHADAAFTNHRPSAQPYSDPFFDGTPLNHDNPDVVLAPPDSVLDWVLVSLRSDVTQESEISGSERTAFLLENGSIVDTTGGLLAFPGVAPGGYYLVVRHRNHVSVMSADTLDLSDGAGSWDFTTAMTQAYTAGGNPMKDLGDGNFGMFACDANADAQITAPDFNLWNAATTAGQTGYRQPDCNMDGQVTAPDFNLWNANTTTGASSKVPD